MLFRSAGMLSENPRAGIYEADTSRTRGFSESIPALKAAPMLKARTAASASWQGTNTVWSLLQERVADLSSWMSAPLPPPSQPERIFSVLGVGASPTTKGWLLPPGAVGGGHSRCRVQRPHIPGVLAVVFKDHTILFHDAGWMSMLLGAEGSGHPLGNVHPTAALVVQADAACRSKASRRISGSSLPRAEALRRIPRQAFGLK